MAIITTEGTPISLLSGSIGNPATFPITASGHLLLVFENDLGSEFVIRGGPTGDSPNFGPLTLEINEPIESSIDRRIVVDNDGNIIPVTPNFRGSTLVPFLDGRLAEDVWEILRQHAVNIDIERLPYSPTGFNSNGTVGNLLDLVGIDINDVQPNPSGIMLFPFVGKNIRFEFDYTITGTERKDKIIGRGGIQEFYGNGGNDTLSGGSGNDILDGGEGIDLALYQGKSSDYTIDFLIDGSVLIIDTVENRDGSDILADIEFAQFRDRRIDLRPGADIAFVIDTTGSMGDDLAAVKARSSDIINAIFDNALNSRIAVVGYNDPSTTTYLSFTDQPSINGRKTAVRNAINSISADGGGDIPEAVNAGLIRALNGGAGEWREEAATRQIILFGDAPPKDTNLRSQVIDLASNLNVSTSGSQPLTSITGDIETRSLNEGLTVTSFAIASTNPEGTSTIVPVEIFTILIDNNSTAQDDFASLADATGGKAFAGVNASELVDTLIAVIEKPKFTTNEDTPVTILASELLSNNTGDNLSLSEVSNPFGGTAILNGDGNIEFTPTSNFNGIASFDYTVTDGTENITKLVEVIVNSVNDLPLANNDTATTDEDINLTISASDLLSNDSDIDLDDSLNISGVDNSVNGTAIFNPDGNIEFTPNPNFNGTASFDYIVTDGKDNATASVEITVNPVNDAPNANNDTFTTDEDTSITISTAELLSNDNDIDGDTISFVRLDTATNGTVVVNNNGDIEFTPDSNFDRTASFEYIITDGQKESTGLAEINVNPVNDLPFLVKPIPDIIVTQNTPDSIVDYAEFFEDIEQGDNLFYSVNFSASTQVFNSISISFDPITRALIIGYGSDNVTGTATFTALVKENQNSPDSVEDIFTVSIINANANGDTLIGADGNDYLAGKQGKDSIDGGAGDDVLLGLGNNDTIVGNQNDTLDGGAGTDELNLDFSSETNPINLSVDLSNSADQVIQGSMMVSNFETIGIITTGTGNDTINLDINSATGGANINGAAGIDLLILNYNNFTTAINNSTAGTIANTDNSSVLLTYNNVERFNLTGTNFSDVIKGLNNNDTLKGQAGNDSLTGGTGNDTLYGGDGNDTLKGEAGNDSVIGSTGNDLLDGGNGNDTLNGNNNNDTLIGLGGNDSLNGGNGNDSLNGGTGNDTLIGGNGTDTINGGDGNDSLVGNNQNDLINGGNGNDTLEGSAGDDIITTGEGTDRVDGGEGIDTISYANLLYRDVSFKKADGIITVNDTDTLVNVEFIQLADRTIDTKDIPEESDINITIAEYGAIALLGDEFETITLDHSFTNPVVFVQPLSFNGSEPASVRLNNITSNSFDVKIQEPDYLDGNHIAEQASYFVFEAGTWQLEDGTLLEVGNANSDGLVTQGFDTVDFSQDFATSPLVFSQVQTNNGADFVRTRQKNATVNGFEFGMEEEEAKQNSGHISETLGWLAIDSGSGQWNNNLYYAGSTGNVVTEEWSDIEFDSLFATQPQFLASLASYNGSDPSGLRYRNLNNNNVQIKIEEDTSADTETTHTTETVNFLSLEGSGTLSTPSFLQNPIMGEVGSIDNLTTGFETINLANTYINPVVFVQPLSFNGSEPAAVRLNNITSNSFDVKIQEPDYLDGNHIAEQASYFVFEAGTWQLEDGTLLEVANANSDGLVTQGFDTVDFSQDFATSPLVFSQVQTNNGADFVRTRQKNATVNGFEFGMEEEEAKQNSGHISETLGWLAIDSGSGQWNNNLYYAGSTGNVVTEEWSDIEFDSLFATQPQFLASLASYNGSDPSGLRYRNLNNNNVQIKVEEDTSADSETTHTTETVNFLSLGSNDSLRALPLTVQPSIIEDTTENILDTEVSNSSLLDF